MSEQETAKETIIAPTFLGYELDPQQNIIANYVVPSITSSLLYILHFACDFAVAYRHFRENNSVWGALTVFIMYLPAISCYILRISSLELWPKFEGCGKENIKWCFIKTLQHVFFPVWSMWRYAEKIFWAIEGTRSKDDDEREDIVNTKLTAPRTIELYYFLQGYLQAAPQILLQLHILMRYTSEMDKNTVDAQVLSVVFSLAQMAKVTTLFQRFKSQNLGGKCYPWFKPYKVIYSVHDNEPQLRRKPSIVYRCKSSRPNTQVSVTTDSATISLFENVKPPLPVIDSRRSSDCYEQPTNSFIEAGEQSKTEFGRETSVVDGPKRLVLKDTEETDFFKPKRLVDIKALPEDDVGGKTVSFLWWFLFLLGRMLAISSFAYFYSTEIIWLLSSHFILVVALLLYDVRYDEVRRAKAIFFIFIGFVYLFCLIEFKIKFKKPKFIYNGFFLLMFIENFTMVLIWWFRNMEDIFNDWWYKYIFYTIIGCSTLSLLSMLLYLNVLKPKKVVINTVSQS